MSRAGDQGSIGLNLEFLPEPALIVDLLGGVRRANSAAANLLMVEAETASLFDIVQDDRDDVATYLHRASRSTASHVGALTLSHGAGAGRFRAFAARMHGADGAEILLIVRLIPAQDDKFTVLNRRLREMDRQLHQRLKENAMLQEALAENKVLLRELQHRVKNNIQQMLSMIKMSAERHRSPEVTEVVNTAAHRLRAMGLTQEALYQNAGADSISARSFVADVVRGAAASYGAEDRLDVSVADERMTSEEAHCLALIAHELITNACKYGSASPAGRVRVRFLSSPEGLRLEVEDDGPGFEERTGSRASGLMLVRGLCRQIGGRLEVSNEQGARCSVHFRSDLAIRNDHDISRAHH